MKSWIDPSRIRERSVKENSLGEAAVASRAELERAFELLGVEEDEL